MRFYLFIVITFVHHISTPSNGQDAPPPIFDAPPPIKLPSVSDTSDSKASKPAEEKVTLSGKSETSSENKTDNVTIKADNETVTVYNATTSSENSTLSQNMSSNNSTDVMTTIMPSDSNGEKQTQVSNSSNFVNVTESEGGSGNDTSSVDKVNKSNAVTELTTAQSPVNLTFNDSSGTENTTITEEPSTASNKIQPVGVLLPPPPPILPEIFPQIFSSSTTSSTNVSEMNTTDSISSVPPKTRTEGQFTTSTSTKGPEQYGTKIHVFLPPTPLPDIIFEERSRSTTVEISTVLEISNKTDVQAIPSNANIENTSLVETTSMKNQTDNMTTSYPSKKTIEQTARATTKPLRMKSSRKTQLAIPPEHPPPIFFKGKPAANNKENGAFQHRQFTRKPPVPTTEQAPPPIFVPQSTKTLEVQKQETVPPSYTRTRYDPSRPASNDDDPRYMSTLELAIFALKNLGRTQNKSKKQKAVGVQTFFPTTPRPRQSSTVETVTSDNPLTTKESVVFTTDTAQNSQSVGERQLRTTPLPDNKQTTVKRNESIVYDKQYYLQKYVFNSQTTEETTTSNSLLLRSNNIKETPIEPQTQAPRRFFDSNYLLSMISEGRNHGVALQNIPQESMHAEIKPFTENPRVAPITTGPSLPYKDQKWTNDIQIKNEAINQITKERAFDSSQMKNQQMGQAETRPMSWKTENELQTDIGYNVNVDVQSKNTNMQMPPVTEKVNNIVATLPTTRRSYSSLYRPRDHVYGSVRIKPILPNDPGHELRERFNRKWFNPDGNEPNIGVIEVPKSSNELITPIRANILTPKPEPTTTESSARKLFNLIFNLSPAIKKKRINNLLPKQPTVQAQEGQKQEQQLTQRHIEQLQNLIDHKRQARQQERLTQLQRQADQRQRQIKQTQQEQFPLASQIAHSETIETINKPSLILQHSFMPKVSSIQIFQAPAFRSFRHRGRSTSIDQRDNKSVQTQWQTRSNRRSTRHQLPVPYDVTQESHISEISLQSTTNHPSGNQRTTQSPFTHQQTPLVLKFHTETTSATTTTTTRPTVPPTADPNPPPIFDTKVQVTFMPMPKIERVTDAPNMNNGTIGWVDGEQGFDERCRGCVFVNDRCLMPDPVHCNIYIECVRQRSMVRAFERECALGSFFDRKSFLCVDPKDADCPTDRCREPGLKWYSVHGHCKHYWACVTREGGGAYAQSECCPDMGGFVAGEGCIENKNCTESCSSPISTGGPTAEAGMNCTCVNTTFCACSDARPASFPATSCQAVLTLDFANNKIEDSSKTKQHIGVEGVTATKEGFAAYSGTDRLVIWRYANLMFPLVFAMRFRFLSTSYEPRFQTIASNCDQKGAREASFEISLDTLYREVIFKVDTYEGPAKKFKIMYPHNKWTYVDVIYDGERLVGAVNRRARNIFAAGGLETRPTPIGIGTCGDNGGFKGYIDNLNVYEDCIPDELYGVFMSVLE